MGHSDAAITMNVYTHAEYSNAQKAMSQICYFSEIQLS